MKVFDQERWLPLRAADGVDGVDGGGAEPSAGEAQPTGPGSGRSDLRQQLEKNFEADRTRDTQQQEPAAKKEKAPRRVAGGAEIDPAPAEAAPAEGAEAAPAEGVAPEATEAPAVAAPEAFSKEAKAEWDKTPPAVQAAITKREADVARGVAELRNRYSDIDQALAPHLDAIRAHGKTPASAVAHLFTWFQAMAANPREAFPALLQSFGYTPDAIFGQQQEPAGEQPAGELAPAVQKYIGNLENKISELQQAFSSEIGTLKGTFAEQTQAKTNEMLESWSQNKPHFQEVRGAMANLLAAGVIPLKDGKVDLDAAYESAVYSVPEIRQKVLAAQAKTQQDAIAAKAAAERKAQQDQADKARKTAVSLNGGAPGVPGQAGAKPGGKRKSVRESILEAREQLAE